MRRNAQHDDRRASDFREGGGVSNFVTYRKWRNYFAGGGYYVKADDERDFYCFAIKRLPLNHYRCAELVETSSSFARFLPGGTTSSIPNVVSQYT